MRTYSSICLVILILLYGCTAPETQDQPNVSTEAVIIENTSEIGLSSQSTFFANSSADDPLLSVLPSMLEQWKNEVPTGGVSIYQYTDRTSNLFDILPEEQVNRDQFDLSPEEERVVGYWFGLDGVGPQDEGISFMNALGKSTYPRIVFYPNKLFVIGWFKNGPSRILRTNGKEIDYMIEFLNRGKWEVRDGMIVLSYYQTRITYEGEKPIFTNLSNPFELPLVPVDALSEVNYSTQPFAPLTQAPETQAMIPYEKLGFTTKGAYYIKSLYYWTESASSNNMDQYSELYSKPASLKSKGITIDDILTSTEGRLLQEYWN